MTANEKSEAAILPHGPGMQLVCDARREEDGWMCFSIELRRGMSVVALEEGTAVPELGLEMMAQGCGMVVAQRALQGDSNPKGGVVGAVRNYEYEARAFSVEEDIAVWVKPDLVEAHLVVCDCELYRGGSEAPSQRARITLVMQEGEKV